MTAEELASQMRAAIEAGDPTGGGMLPLDDADNPRAVVARLDVTLRLVGDCPGVVFWVGTSALTEDLLHDHLRRLNKMLVPAMGSEIALPGPDETYELVIFRHADANALAQVIPALDPPQLSRFFGLCLQIIHASDWEWAAASRIIDRPQDLPPAPRGPLRLTPATIRKMEALRMAGPRCKVMTYLRKVDPEDTRDLSDDALHQRVLDHEASGNAIGLQSERAHMNWAYLMSITDGEAGKGPLARRTFRDSDKHPDEAIDYLLNALEKAI